MSTGLMNGHTITRLDDQMGRRGRSPLTDRLDHDAPSIFRPENMLREARRQKGLPNETIPGICILDPDGDVVLHVRNRLGAKLSQAWACYHTELWEWDQDGIRFGVVGCAVGGAFAVLVAEQLFVSGCAFLISLTSAGQIIECAEPPYHILVERALRDEGTSHHYLPAGAFAEADPFLVEIAAEAIEALGYPVCRGATWTTDAPFRETAEIIEARRNQGILGVEMEAAGLYAFASARRCPVLCLAYVTNRMGQIEGDFEKGEDNGTIVSLRIIAAIAASWSGQSAVLARALRAT